MRVLMASPLLGLHLVGCMRAGSLRALMHLARTWRGIAMVQSAQPEIITLVACPPTDTVGSTDNLFIDTALRTLRNKKVTGNRIIQVASVRDADLELSKVLSDRFKGTV